MIFGTVFVQDHEHFGLEPVVVVSDVDLNASKDGDLPITNWVLPDDVDNVVFDMLIDHVSQLRDGLLFWPNSLSFLPD